MATHSPTMMRARWESAVSDNRIADDLWAQVEGEPETSFLLDLGVIRYSAWKQMLRTPAPDIAAVRQKLEALWDDTLFDEHGNAGRWKRKLLGDLERVALVREGLSLVADSGWSEEDIAAQADEWKEAVAGYFHAAGKFHLARDEAAAAALVVARSRVLDAVASTLPDIAFKLRLLWELELWVDVPEWEASQAIVTDLQRIGGFDLLPA